MDNNNFYTYTYRNPENTETEVKSEVKSEQKSKSVSVKVLVISLIICMIVSICGGVLFTSLIIKSSGQDLIKIISTTNYDLVASTGSELTIQEIVAKNENSVVAITTESLTTSSFLGQYVQSGAGSGLIYSEDGYIITNNHVIENATKITVTLYNGTTYDATLVSRDEISDLAVLKIDETGLDPIEFGDSDKLTVGDLAVVIGNPLGTLSGTATEGIISALARTITLDGRQMSLIQTSAAINPGNSGGGMFDHYGNLIGVVVAKSSGDDVEGLGFAIPVNKVKTVVESLIEKGYVSGRPQVGITILDLTSVSNAWQYGVSYPGVYINEVTGDAAKASGLKAGDMLYKIDGQLITSSTMFIQIIQNHNVGDKVTLTIVRNSELDKMITIEVTLEEAKSN